MTKFVLELWPDEEDQAGKRLSPGQLVQRAIDSVRDHGEELAWEIDMGDAEERLVLVEPADLLALRQPPADVVLRLTKDEVAALGRGEAVNRQVESEIGHPDAMGVVTVELTGEA